MSWLRRLLLLAGLVTGAWLLGSSGEANADVKVEIDQVRVEVKLPVADIGLKLETGLVPQQPEAPEPAPGKPDPRTEPPAPPQPPQPAAPAPAPVVQAETPQPQHHAPPPPLTTRPTDPAPVPQQQRQPQVEPPITGTLPQSGAGTTTTSQIPAGTLTYAMRPPTTTTSLVSTEQQDVPRTVRAEEPTFSPD
jgi:outer membrane biosynthesis protein TonB